MAAGSREAPMEFEYEKPVLSLEVDRSVTNSSVNPSFCVRVMDATSNDPGETSSTLLQKIAQGTFDSQSFNEIMPSIYNRLTETNNWHQPFKALQLLEYIIKHGSAKVADDARTHITTIKMLRNFHHTDPNETDFGIIVRNRAEELVDWLYDLDRFRSERQKEGLSGANIPAASSRIPSYPNLPLSDEAARMRPLSEPNSLWPPPRSQSDPTPPGMAGDASAFHSRSKVAKLLQVWDQPGELSSDMTDRSESNDYVDRPPVRRASRGSRTGSQSSRSVSAIEVSRLRAENELLRKRLEDTQATNDQIKQNFSNLQEAYEVTLGQFSSLQIELSKLEVQSAQSELELAQLKNFNIFNLKGPEAVAMCDYLQSRIDQDPDAEASSLLLRLLQDLCVSSDQLPTSCWVSDLDVHHLRVINRGGEAIIFQGTYKGQTVAVRSIFPPEDASWESHIGKETIKLIRREILTHRQLKHPNIISLIGIFQEDASRTPPLIVLPFYPLGSTKSWLKENRSSEFYLSIVIDIIQGLKYLHGRTPPVIHGDLHSGNILVVAGPQAVLCDFGFSRVKHDVSRLLSKVQITQNMRFLAPELFAPYATVSEDDINLVSPSVRNSPVSISDTNRIRSTQQSDLYSLGMTLYDLGTLQFPFHTIASPFVVAEKVLQGERPERPDSLGGFTDQITNDRLWSIISGLWSHDPQARPLLDDVEKELMSIRRE